MEWGSGEGSERNRSWTRQRSSMELVIIRTKKNWIRAPICMLALVYT